MKGKLINKPPTDLKLEKIFQKIGLGIARKISNFPITPNHVTVLKLPLGALMVYSISMEKFYLAGLTIVLVKILDKVDGALARITKKTTKFGAWLDMSLDRVFWSIMLFTLTLRSYQDTKSLTVWIVLSLILFLNLIFQNLFYLNSGFPKTFSLSDQKQKFKKSLKINLIYEAIFSFYYLFEEFVAIALILYVPIKNILQINTIAILLYSYAVFFTIATSILAIIEAKSLIKSDDSKS